MWVGGGLRADEGDREGRKLSMHSCNHIYDSVVLDDISQSIGLGNSIHIVAAV